MAEDGGDLLPVGYVRRAHGIAGDVLVAPLTDVPEQRYRVGVSLLTDEDPPRSLAVTAVRPHKDGLLLSIAGIDDRNAAEAMRGVTLRIPLVERRSLGDDEFWPDDLSGLSAVDSSGRKLGVVTGVVFGAAQDRLVVSTEGGDFVEVPFVSEIVIEVSAVQGRVVIDPPDGLF
jgi:16S rRNA processing protein RimM